VTDPITPSAIGRFVPPIANWVEEANQGENEWLRKLSETALKKLQDVGLDASFSILSGNPKQVLIEEAENWHADSIFVGANRFGSWFERFMLGSVSAAIAARAHCSVEVVRTITN
jgi:nucleotide-binding universal stress UspA family protein